MRASFFSLFRLWPGKVVDMSDFVTRREGLFPQSIGFHYEDEEGNYDAYLFFCSDSDEFPHDEIVEWIFVNNLQDACLTEQGLTRDDLEKCEMTFHGEEEYDNFTFEGETHTVHMPDGGTGYRLSNRYAGERFEVSSVGPFRVVVLDHDKLKVAI